MFDAKLLALRLLEDMAPQGVFATDRDLVIRYWNPWMEHHSGRSAAETIGRPLLGLYPDVAERKLDREYQRVLAGQTVVLAQRFHHFLIPLPTGAMQSPSERMRQSVRMAPLVDDGQIIGTVTVIEDVSERVQREGELQRQVSLQQALVEVTRNILTLDLDDCLRHVVTEAAALLGAELVAVILRQGDTYRLGASTQPVDAVDGQNNLSGLAAAVAQSGDSFLVEDVQSVPELERHLPLNARSRSLVATPLLFGEKTIGVLVAESERVKAFGDVERAMLLSFSLHAAVAIGNAHLHEELQETLAEVKTLKGFIPICASCRKIRDDAGYWDQIESYVTRHSGAQFSHGICPDCAKRLYPGLLDESDQ